MSEVIRSKQWTLGFLAFGTLLCTGILIYCWAQTDAQIDRGSKIGLSVFLGFLLAAMLLAAIGTASSRVFNLQTTSVGYRYPASFRYFLYAMCITLGIFTLVILSADQIANKSTQTGLAVTTAILSVLSGVLGLYFHSTILPVDFSALEDFSKKSGLPIFFPKDLFEDSKFAYALAETTTLPDEMKDLFYKLRSSHDYPSFIEALQDVPFADITKFKNEVMNAQATLPSQTLLSYAKEKATSFVDDVKAKTQDIKDSVKTLRSRFQTQPNMQIDKALRQKEIQTLQAEKGYKQFQLQTELKDINKVLEEAKSGLGNAAPEKTKLELEKAVNDLELAKDQVLNELANVS